MHTFQTVEREALDIAATISQSDFFSYTILGYVKLYEKC